VTFVVVGTDKVHYGSDLKYIKENTFRHHILSEGGYDLTRFRFTGYVQQETLADILSAADTHLYLTEPFIASWSMVDAMSCGAVLIASDQTCVREYVVPGENGLLVNFFDHEALAEQALDVLADGEKYRPLTEAAIRTVAEKFSLDVAIPRIRDFFERVAATRRSPSMLLEKLVRKGTMEVITSDPEALARKAKLTESPSGTAAGAAAADGVGDSAGNALAATGTPLEQAVAKIRLLGEKARTVSDWVHQSLAFAGPKPDFESIGPRNHPVDLQRLMNRLAEWKATTLVEIGVREGGTLFLFAQMAGADALLVTAGTPEEPIQSQRIPFLRAMARPRQRIVCIPQVIDGNQLVDRVKTATENRPIDFLFLHGRRAYEPLAADYRALSKLVREGGLIAWDGISPVAPFGPERDGGHRLWQEVQSQFPQRAEYLNGAATEYGGIAMIKV
jgi:predicted O-methyltransferase YrrM/ADP-ribose pyrophosphatase YjhB (NUDIX family)